jgi:IclR family acetate operon transcriptional repressor
MKPVRPPLLGRKPVGAGHTQALSRGLAILDALAVAPGGATLTAVAEQVSLPAPTVHRLLATLEQDRYVAQGAGGAWRVGVRAFRVGSAFLEYRNLVAVAHPMLHRLMEDTGETALLALLDGFEAIVVDQVECDALLRTSAKLGARVPLHASAAGKAMLMGMNDEDFEAALAAQPLAALGPRTLVTREALAADLATARERGCALEDEEQAAGLRALGAALRDEHGGVLAAVAVSGPVSRITPERIEALARQVRDAADDIAFALDGRTRPR